MLHVWRKRWLMLAGLGLLTGLAGGITVLSFSSDTAQSVSVRDEDGEVITRTNLNDALKEASIRSGFKVVAPAEAPGGLQVHAIWVQPAAYAAPGQPPIDFRVVTLQLQVGNAEFLLDELKAGFNPALSGELLSSAVPSGEVYYDATDTAVIYSMLVKGRGFILSFPAESALSRSVALEILRGFAKELV